MVGLSRTKKQGKEEEEEEEAGQTEPRVEWRPSRGKQALGVAGRPRGAEWRRRWSVSVASP